MVRSGDAVMYFRLTSRWRLLQPRPSGRGPCKDAPQPRFPAPAGRRGPSLCSGQALRSRCTRYPKRCHPERSPRSARSRRTSCRAHRSGLAGASVLSRAPGGGSAGAVARWGRRRQTDGAQPNGCAPLPVCALREASRPRPRRRAPRVRSQAGPALGVRTSGFRVVEPSPLLDVPIAAPPEWRSVRAL